MVYIFCLQAARVIRTILKENFEAFHYMENCPNIVMSA